MPNSLLTEEIDGAVAPAELHAFTVGGEIQVQPVALNGAAAVLCHTLAVDILAVIGDNEHPGAVGNHRGIDSHGTDVDRSAGGGCHVAARIRVRVGGCPHASGVGVGQDKSLIEKDKSLLIVKDVKTEVLEYRLDEMTVRLDSAAKRHESDLNRITQLENELLKTQKELANLKGKQDINKQIIY